MNHIVVNIHPFVMRQEVSAYIDGVCLKHIECSLDDVDKVIYGLSREFDIHQVDYTGNVDFGLKLEQKLSTNYNNYELNFSFF